MVIIFLHKIFLHYLGLNSNQKHHKMRTEATKQCANKISSSNKHETEYPLGKFYVQFQFFSHHRFWLFDHFSIEFSTKSTFHCHHNSPDQFFFNEIMNALRKTWFYSTKWNQLSDKTHDTLLQCDVGLTVRLLLSEWIVYMTVGATADSSMQVTIHTMRLVLINQSAHACCCLCCVKICCCLCGVTEWLWMSVYAWPQPLNRFDIVV